MTTPGAPSPFGFPGFPQQPGQPPAQQGSALSGVFQNQPPQQIPQAQPFPPGIMIPQGQPQVQINPMQLAQMQAEEAAQRAAQAQLQAGQAPGSVAPPAGILDICGKISAIGKGFPRLEGQAAQAVAMAAGASVPPDHVYPGQGEIQGVVISDPNMLPQLLTQLQDLASRQAPTPPAQLPPQAGGILPGDAPPSNPMLASSGPPVQPQQTVAQGGPLASMTAEPAPKKRKSKADKETEAAAAALAAQQVAMQNQAPGLSAFAPQQQAQTFTTVIGSQGVPHQVQQVQYAPQPRQMQDQPQFMVNADTGVHLYVDVTHLSGNGYERFEPIAAALNKGLAMEAGAKDVRCAPSEGPLGFGRWKGVILPAIRDKFLAQIPPGRYLYDARGNEFHEEVATAMREICMERGWTWMRGLG